MKRARLAHPISGDRKKSGSLPKHLIEQIRMPIRVLFFDDNDHLANSVNNPHEPTTTFHPIIR
jgi:hypothetical protein